MPDLEQELRTCYLDRLDDPDWNDWDPGLTFGSRALPYFIAAFENETDPQHRARLIRAIWQFRDPAALPALAAALRDSSCEVWQDALDGIVALRGDRALVILKEARAALAPNPAEAEKLEWIDEAAVQVANGF